MELLVAKSLTVLLQGFPLFADVDLVLRRGERIGLVGANGAGKSTLLAVLAGARPPDEGLVLRAPGVQLERVGQEPPPPHATVRELVTRSQRRLHELESALRAEERRLAAGEPRLDAYGRLLEEFENAGGYRAETEARATLEALALPEDGWDRRAHTLSGGEQRRLRLALALAARPDVLLLDEPTNHLDLPRRRALAERLGRFAGGLLLVSHDRALLDGVCTHIALLERRRLRRHRGNYQTFEERRTQSRAQEARRQRERAKEEKRLAETVAQLRHIGNRAAARRRKRFERRLDELQSASAHGADPTAGRALSTTPRAASGPLLSAQHLSKHRGGRLVIDDVGVVVHAGDRVALIGANGSGKSTLLALLAGDLPSDDPRATLRYGDGVRLAVADQHRRGLAPSEPPLAALERLVTGERARNLLARAGLPPERWQVAAETLSGGERARAGLARIAASEANLLLLDEPANDLDLDGIEQLEHLLREGGATLIFTSHDQRLIERVAGRVWSLENGELVEYRGGFAGYTAGARRLEPDLAEPDMIPAGAPTPPAADDPGDPAAPLEDELREIEWALLDPLRLGERAAERLERRRRALIEELAQLYDERLPAPPPRFAAREQGLEVRAELAAPGHDVGLDVRTPLPLTIEVRVVGDVAHLRLLPQGDLCPLDWALRATLTACARLCLYLLPVRAVQVQSERDLSATPFAAAGHGWWLLSRSELERREGWRRGGTPTAVPQPG